MANVVAPTKWKFNTLNLIRDSTRVNHDVTTKVRLGHINDPMPSFHDQVVLESNTKILRYMREIRQLVMSLRGLLSESNEEVKRLLNTKRTLERCLEHMRKDLEINVQTTQLRSKKPLRELSKDQADSMLQRERKELTELKHTTEHRIKEVQEQLQQLDNSRKQLNHILNERNQVLDLLAEHVKSSTKVTNANRSAMPETSHDMIINSSDARRENAIVEEHIKQSKILRQHTKSLIANIYRKQQMIYEKVNQSLVGRIAETVSLEQRLTSAYCENVAVSNKLQRHKDLTNASKGYLLGAVNADDIALRQHVTRPMVKIFQRHPGTQLPEEPRISGATKQLDLKVNDCNDQQFRLRRARTDIEMDKKSKRTASAIDESLVRLRRQHANHRWVMGNKTRIGSAVSTVNTAVTKPWYTP